MNLFNKKKSVIQVDAYFNRKSEMPLFLVDKELGVNLDEAAKKLDETLKSEEQQTEKNSRKVAKRI